MSTADLKNKSSLEKSQTCLSSKGRNDGYKMVLLIRMDLGMGKGKIVAQACHGAVGVVTNMLASSEEEKKIVRQWEDEGGVKIALKINSEQEIDSFYKQAQEINLPSYLVYDAGHTQLDPNTKTVLAIGPAKIEEVDALTNKLKLL